MARKYEKLIITNRARLKAKYGVAGERKVRAALTKAAEADRERGLSSHVLLLDNAATMKALKATPITDHTDWAATLRAVDKAWQKYSASYVMIVGSADVVAQTLVTNPFGAFSEDGDPVVPSDVPYACDLPARWKPSSDGFVDPADLLRVTRVVGRLPDIPGATDPTYLVDLLAATTKWKSRPVGDYHGTFALSAAAWADSTQHSVALLAGAGAGVKLSPPVKAPWTKPAVQALVHFVNCHGGDTTPDWFGQAPPVRNRPSPVDTVALRPEDIDGRVRTGTIVAAECCYGSMHMNPDDIDGRLGMLWAYLRSGAYAGIGASTTAYGPAEGLGQADLLTRFALESILTGASTGRALLEARQRFVRETGDMDPSDLKTLVQFDLLGDPSVHPVRSANEVTIPKSMAATSTSTSKKAPAPSAARVAATPLPGRRAERRRALTATGRALAQSVSRAAPTPRRRAGISADELVAASTVRGTQAVGPARSFDEASQGPKYGVRYHAAPIRVGARPGFVIARQRGREITVSTVLAKTETETLVGRIEERIVGKGSKSEMPGVVLVTDSDDRPVVLRRKGAEALSADPELAAYSGQLVRVRGRRAMSTFVVDHIEAIESTDDVMPDGG